jgi:hypothetical protein
MLSLTMSLGPIFPANMPRATPGRITPDEMMGQHSLYYPLGAPLASLTMVLEASRAAPTPERGPEPRPPPIATVKERGAKLDISM